MFMSTNIDQFNPISHNPNFQQPLERSLLKTLWEKEKMLINSIFFLFPQCFLVLDKKSIFE